MDLKIIETGDGGDFVFDNGDLLLTSEVYNQPYLAHFGGNIKAVNSEFQDGEKRLDWWGNAYLQSNEQLNSTFEKTLQQTELSSSGRIKIEEAAKVDLSYLEGFANAESSVSITGVDKVKLQDKINNENVTNYSYIWSEAKDEIVND